MDVKRDGRTTPYGGGHVVSRPHLLAYLWYAFWAVLLGTLTAGVLRMIVWDGSAMMFVPVCVAVAFGAPLVLVLRNLTTVAIVEPGSVEFRRFFMRAWRLDRGQVFHVAPTRGVIEGPLRFHAFNALTREMPGFLMRGMRGTWVEEMRDAPSSSVFDNMSREEREAFVKVVRRSVVERDETFGKSPDERWRNWTRWDKEQRLLPSVGVGLALISHFLPPYRELWLLDVAIVAAAVAISIKALMRRGVARRTLRETGLVMFALPPGIMLAIRQYNWQILDPGLLKIALFLAGAIWFAALIPPWRAVAWGERIRYLVFSVFMFGATAFWAHGMLAFANRRFDEKTMPILDVATVLRIEERRASRSTPASVVVDLGSSRTFGAGVTAEFTHDAMPAGDLAIGGQCVLMVRPGLFHVRWLEVAVCRSSDHMPSAVPDAHSRIL
jgi:hypothetical protein